MVWLLWRNTAKRFGRIPFVWDSYWIRRLLVESAPYGVALFLNTVYFKVDMAMLASLQPRDIADKSIGLYGASMKMVEVGMMFGTYFLNSMIRAFTDAIRA